MLNDHPKYVRDSESADPLRRAGVKQFTFHSPRGPLRESEGGTTPTKKPASIWGGGFRQYGGCQDMASWASLGPLLAHLGASWVSLGSSQGPLGAKGGPKEGQGSQQEAQERPREPQQTFRERPEEPKNVKRKHVKCMFFVSQRLLP